MNATERHNATIKIDFTTLQRDLSDIASHLKNDPGGDGNRLKDKVLTGADDFLEPSSNSGTTKTILDLAERHPILPIMFAGVLGYISGRRHSR